MHVRPVQHTPQSTRSPGGTAQHTENVRSRGSEGSVGSAHSCIASAPPPRTTLLRTLPLPRGLGAAMVPVA
jgi:hypothetical protein